MLAPVPWPWREGDRPNQDIATAFSQSTRTVEHHVANVLRKLGTELCPGTWTPLTLGSCRSRKGSPDGTSVEVLGRVPV
ncbi:LuxR C-terminal-related transcriptional regulator [Kitasatospora sp. NPDC057015]|uniref:LuxR C-terminal-related transcriptional regulator n=1 Tax=Kitasatospora sp. NPDC057015 TaxID=3346001 RepID=UPI00362A8DA3